MKTVSSAIRVTVFTLWALCLHIAATAGTPTRDTSQAAAHFQPVDMGYSPVVLVRRANVQFPALFSEHREAALAYIEQFAAARRAYVNILFQKSRTFFPQAECIFEEMGVPSEFKMLMAIESGFNSHIVSPAGAKGYWQFMKATAREYGLRVNMKVKNPDYRKPVRKKNGRYVRTKVKRFIYLDDRTDFVKSTYAAAQYLKDRCAAFNNDWLLVAASYNCGEGNVRKAMRRSGIAQPGFWDIQSFLPRETRNYVMNFIAMNVLYRNYDQYQKEELCFRDVIIAPEECERQGTGLEQSWCHQTPSLR